MASTSPYTSPDYQAANVFRPYNLPVNSVMGALVAQNQFWNEGASRIKQQYENVLDLKLQTTENRELRDQFIKESEKSLQKLSSMNLADGSVQRQGFDIFKPIYRDENIVGEDYTVRQMDKELAIGESYRNKDKGQAYNPTSIQNIRFEKNLLNGPLNRRDGWKPLYGNTSQYVPYTDNSKELKQIEDTIRANEIQTAQLKGDGWYIEEIKKKGVSKDRMLEAIKTMGSPQLKAQIKAEGRNHYYNLLQQEQQDPGAADRYFKSLAGSYYDGRIGEMESRKAELAYQNFLTPQKGEGASRKQLLNDQITELEGDIQSAKKDKQSYVSQFQGLGNYDSIGANLSKVESLWEQSSLDALARKTAYQEESHTLGPNSVRIAQENINVARQRLNLEGQKLNEGRRQFEKENEREWYKILHPAKKEGESKDVDLFELGNNPDIATNEVAQMNRKTQDELAEGVIKDLTGTQEALKASAVVNVMGKDAWDALQQGVNNNAVLGSALQPTELENAARLFKAFNDKYAGTYYKGGDNHVMKYVTGATEEAIQKHLSGMDIRQFKRALGTMIEQDPDLVSDLSRKFAKENGNQDGTNFRSLFNEVQKTKLNISSLIDQRVKPALGDFSKYFDNVSGVITEEGLKKGFTEYQKDKNHPLFIYQQPITSVGFTPGSSRYTPQPEARLATAEEMKQYNEGKLPTNLHGAYQRPMTYDEFKNQIGKLSHPAIASIAVENNRNVRQTSFEDKDKAAKAQVVGQFSRIVALPNNTDGQGDNEELISFLKKNSDHIKMVEQGTPKAGRDFPTVRFTLEDIQGQEDLVEKINQKDFEVTKSPAELFQKGNGSNHFRGAVLVTAPAKMPNGEQGEVKITNMAVKTGELSPMIEVKNIYTYQLDPSTGKPVIDPKTGAFKKLPITKEDIIAQYENARHIPFQTALSTQPQDVNAFITSSLMHIEDINEEITQHAR